MRVCPQCSLETEETVCPQDGATTFVVQSAVSTYDPGTIINERYRIDEVLGIGGFGAVYKCKQLNMDQVVAVKVLRSEHLTSVEHVKRFTREAQAASKLKHPNTISMFDFGTHVDGALYLAMEYLNGETLANRLELRTMLNHDEMVHIMVQICHSLTEAHEANLIHRDLKPENIMLMSVAGDTNFVKVLDFGIAKIETPTAPNEERLTEAGMIMGTPTYMSPEQARGEPLDARSDIYALGVLMYECLTGRVPFEGDQPMTVLVKHIKDPPPPPREVAPELKIPRAIEKVVLRCLEKVADHRPQLASELAEALLLAKDTPDAALQRKKPGQDGEAGDVYELLTESMPGASSEDVASGSAVETELVEALQTPRQPDHTRGAQPPPPPRNTATDRPAALWLGLIAFALVAVIAVIVALVETPTPSQSPATPTQPAPVNPPSEITPAPQADDDDRTRRARRTGRTEPRVDDRCGQPGLGPRPSATASERRKRRDLAQPTAR